MSGEAFRRDALSHLHGPQFRHGIISLRTRGGLFGLREALRTMPSLSSRHRPLPDNLSSPGVDKRRQTQFKISIRKQRNTIRCKTLDGSHRREDPHQRDQRQQHDYVRPPDRAKIQRRRENCQDFYLPNRKGLLGRISVLPFNPLW